MKDLYQYIYSLPIDIAEIIILFIPQKINVYVTSLNKIYVGAYKIDTHIDRIANDYKNILYPLASSYNPVWSYNGISLRYNMKLKEILKENESTINITFTGDIKLFPYSSNSYFKFYKNNYYLNVTL
jgi:hypothetical protein